MRLPAGRRHTAAIVVPSGRLSIPITASCFVPGYAVNFGPAGRAPSAARVGAERLADALGRLSTRPGLCVGLPSLPPGLLSATSRKSG